MFIHILQALALSATAYTVVLCCVLFNNRMRSNSSSEFSAMSRYMRDTVNNVLCIITSDTSLNSVFRCRHRCARKIFSCTTTKN